MSRYHRYVKFPVLEFFTIVLNKAYNATPNENTSADDLKEYLIQKIRESKFSHIDLTEDDIFEFTLCRPTGEYETPPEDPMYDAAIGLLCHPATTFHEQPRGEE
jgi:hypothetical protein